MERINAERVAAGEMKTTAFQIWVQMTHRGRGFADRGGGDGLLLEGTAECPSGEGLVPVWVAMILAQIGLGAWTIWSDKAADVATAHMALGALSLLVGALLTFRLFCGARSRDFILPDAPNRRLIERIA